VQVIEEAFEDASEPDAKGFFDYYYSGVIYRFIFSKQELKARVYDDTPGTASFLGYTTLPEGERGLFEAIPYDDPEFGLAAAYLRDTVGADRLQVLLPGGYVPVDFNRFPGSADANSGELFHCFQCRSAIPEGLDKCPKCGWTWE
jgi:hypothetical protein